MTGRRVTFVGAALVVVLLAVTGVVLGLRGGTAIEVTADFEDTTGLYVGNEVTYLGVAVGEVVEVEPRGTSMRVHLRLEPGTRVPAEAGAEILQSALVTDRYVELGPAYTGGATLVSGDHVPADRTRSPATIDEIGETIDGLVRALATTGRDGADLGDLLAATAQTLEGTGDKLRTALVAGEDAVATVTDNGDDLRGLVADLAAVVDLLADRDRRIRRFVRATGQASGVLAEQRHEATRALRALTRLTGEVGDFLRDNSDVVSEDLRRALRVTRTVAEHEGSLEEAFDVMPTLAQNYARAYDWDLGRLRVQFSFAVGPFSAMFRSHFCKAYGLPMCQALLRPDGTGLLDPLLDGLFGALPGEIP
ncbi:MCE family protein [Nocardioides massiliensis]|uniref:Phospholipid/cholesterol/gamma-HCH transport system substrate-binding protein n=1 Tax=Nocardioides massiliensis TaxID=1325935 RepID=A0ABT9NPL3_9ACTN|nr:MCE family protein [Nocardioides massiliensis]MDP9822354.1 phospholipid/cholesterol/gamma-HCH transport system substrate-binding protein [Nocardioides massiliensis]